MEASLFRLRHFTLALLGVFLLSYTASSQNLSGPLSGTLGPGTYYIVSAISVGPGDSLTLEPGTVFLFNGNFDFKVFGKLTAIGTETDSIKFMQNSDYIATWDGIDFYGAGTDSSRFEYCVVKGSNCIGLEFVTSSPTFLNCTIIDNDSGG